jgi:hypothetical protein
MLIFFSNLSPSLGGFRYIGNCYWFFIRLATEENLIVNIIGLFQVTGKINS